MQTPTRLKILSSVAFAVAFFALAFRSQTRYCRWPLCQYGPCFSILTRRFDIITLQQNLAIEARPSHNVTSVSMVRKITVFDSKRSEDPALGNATTATQTKKGVNLKAYAHSALPKQNMSPCSAVNAVNPSQLPQPLV